MADRNVRRIEEQIRPIHWLDHVGQIRRHTFDVRVTRTCGRRTEVIAKRKEVADKPEFKADLERIVAWTPFSVAHEILLVTEQDIPWWAARNAALIRTSIMDLECDIDKELRALEPTSIFPTSIRKFGEQVYDISLTFRPIARLIGGGVLEVLNQGPLSEHSLIRLGGGSMTNGHPSPSFRLPVELGPLDAVMFGSEPYRILKQVGEHFFLESKAYSWRKIKISRQELQASINSQDASIVPSYFGLRLSHTAESSSFAFLAAYAPDVQRQIIVDFTCVSAIWHSRKTTGKPALTAQGINQFYAERRTELLAEIDRNLGPPKVIASRKSRSRLTYDFLKPTQLKEKYKNFVASGQRPESVKNNYENSIFGGVKLAPEIKNIIEGISREYATQRSPTYKGLHRKIKRRIYEINTARATDDQLTTPSLSTVTRAAKKLPVGQVIHARLGPASMEQALGQVSQVPKYSRIGERVKQDCWEIHLLSVLAKIGRGTKKHSATGKEGSSRGSHLDFGGALCRHRVYFGNSLRSHRKCGHNRSCTSSMHNRQVVACCVLRIEGRLANARATRIVSG